MSGVQPSQGIQHTYQPRVQGTEAKTAGKVNEFMNRNPLQGDPSSKQILERLAPGKQPKGSLITGVSTGDIKGSVLGAKKKIG